MVEDPEDVAFVDITCRDCHNSRRDYIAEIYIPLKTTIIIASQDWCVWKHYLELNREAPIESLSQHLFPDAAKRLQQAASETRMGEDTPEDDQCLCSFDMGPEEYVQVTRRLEIALAAQMVSIRSGNSDATDHQLEYLLALDLQI